MRNHILALALLFAATGRTAADPPPTPKDTHDVPAMGGKRQALPSHSVIGVMPNEVAVAGLLGTKLRGRNSKDLGTISGFLFDRTHDKVALIAVARPGNRATITVPWGNLRKTGQPAARLTTDLSSDALNPATPYDQVQREKGYIDLAQAIINHPVALRDGTTGGTVTDFIAEMGGGTIDYVLGQ
jgi:hypothetical protein